MAKPAGLPIAVYLEVGDKRTFACALDWPGWCRSGKTAQDALEALLAYRDRYARVAVRAKAGFKKPAAVADFKVAEHLKGNATTDFGAPGVPPKADARALAAPELKRLTSLLEASWLTLDDMGASAAGVELRKGPRGGGRDLPKMVMHVLEAEEAYLTGLGSKVPRPKKATVEARTKALREAVLAAVEARAADKPLADPNKVEKRWSPRYFVRRAAWHALDHAWEIEDRAIP